MALWGRGDVAGGQGHRCCGFASPMAVAVTQLWMSTVGHEDQLTWQVKACTESPGGGGTEPPLQS